MKRKFKHSKFKLFFASIDPNLTSFNLLIIILSVNSIARGSEIIINAEELAQGTRIYANISQYVDIVYYGMFLIIPSMFIFLTLFLTGRIKYALLGIGNFFMIPLYLLYITISADTFFLTSSIISNLVYASVHLIMLFISIVVYWQLTIESTIEHYGRREIMGGDDGEF